MARYFLIRAKQAKSDLYKLVQDGEARNALLYRLQALDQFPLQGRLLRSDTPHITPFTLTVKITPLDKCF